MKCCALAAALATGCGDDPATTGGASSTSAGGETTTSTQGHVPTTSHGDTTETGTASMSGTTTTLPTTSATPATSDTTADDTTSAVVDTTTLDTTTLETTAEGTTTLETTTLGTTTSTTADTSSADDSTTGGCASPADCPSADECQPASCDAGLCGLDILPAGSPCSSGVCTDLGVCVNCLFDVDCPAMQVCVANTCEPAPPSCSDSVKNGSETDLDCGGSCPPCADGQTCQTSGDCTSTSCNAGVCGPPPPTCVDNSKNGSETDTDCGGPTCPKCPNGDTCTGNADCLSNACTNNVCGPPPPTCNDNLKNGSETDTDCGGATCPKCNNGDTCLANTDCISTSCNNNVCGPPPPTCNDTIQNGSETDTDCGGATCPKCIVGDSCLVNTDCTSATCTANVCVDPAPMCTQQQADPATGQKCPLFTPCTQSSECGTFQGCQQWFCNNSKTCELNALVNCWTTVGGACNADVVFTQQTLPPVAKRFLPPDGVTFREVASLVFTIKNNTASDLYLDKLPLTLDVMGNGSKFDVSSVKIFQNSGGSEHGPGDLLVCLTADPFSFPANGIMGPCAGSSFSKILKGQSNQFLVNVAFAANKTFIAGRSYRLRLPTATGTAFKVGFNGPAFAGTLCGVPGDGYTGAWVTAQNP